MTKQEFLGGLSAKLSSLPRQEIDKSLSYYAEIIDDRMEEGMAEEDAVAALGDAGEIASNIMYDMSIPALMKAKIGESKSKASNKVLWLVLVILGFPLWFPLLMAFASVLVAVYFTVWAVIISLCAVVVALGTACAAGIVSGLAMLFMQSAASGLSAVGLALICGALTLFMIKPVWLIIRALIRFTASVIRKVKSLFIEKRGESNENE